MPTCVYSTNLFLGNASLCTTIKLHVSEQSLCVKGIIVRWTMAENIHAESGINKKKTVSCCSKEKLNTPGLCFTLKYLNTAENSVLFLILLKHTIGDPVLFVLYLNGDIIKFSLITRLTIPKISKINIL